MQWTPIFQLFARQQRLVASLLGIGWLCLGVPSASAQTDVTDADELRAAIIAANAGSDTTINIINIANDITLDVALVPIEANIMFVGGGNTVSGDQTFQVFFVDSGMVTFSDMTIRDGASLGGDGGAGRGGGGLGAGGALFVNENGAVTLDNVQFIDNVATGGDGGADFGPDKGGGGGGFHGDGGGSLAGGFGGGGGGYNGDGADSAGGGGGLEGNGFRNDQGCLTDSGGNGGGKFDDGDGGSGGGVGCGAPVGPIDADGAEFEGGGNGSPAGDGGRFGGGGGSGQNQPGDGGEFGGGGGAVNILGTSDVATFSGGTGGFGGGGGGGTKETVADGGFGAGDGSAIGPGGAGSSLGGAIFVRNGGTITFQIDADGPLTSGNQVNAASGSGSPEVAGQDLYLMNGVEASFAVSSSFEASLSGSIAGEGGLLKEGTGTLVLGGTNSYAGGTLVEEGTLAGNSASLQGAITIDFGTTLEFRQDGSGTYSGVVSGDGDLVKKGTGTLVLAGSNDYVGTTDVEAGTLSVTSTSLPVPTGGDETRIRLSATLLFDQSSDGTFSGEIKGSGNLRKSGSGTLTLSAGQHVRNGRTWVDGGKLVLDGNLGSFLTTVAAGATVELAAAGSLSRDATVEPGGRIEGTGSVGRNLSLSGTVAPGNPASDPLGTLTVGQDVTMTGATLEVRANASGQSNLLRVTGAASLDGNLDLALEPGDYGTPLNFVVLTASSVTGSLTDPADTCVLDISTSTSATALTVSLNPNFSRLPTCAQTSNQRAVGGALVPNLGDPALSDVRNNLFPLSDDEVADALDQMSGEGLLGFSSARLAAGTQFMNTLSQRMRDPGELGPEGAQYPLGFGGPLLPSLGASAGRLGGSGFGDVRSGLDTRKHSPFSFVSLRGESGLGGWLDGFAVFAGIDGDGNSHDSDFNLYGTSAGVDYAFGQGLVAGAAVGYTRSKLSISDVATWGTGDTWQGALYGAYATDHFYVGGAARYAYTSIDTKRNVSFNQFYETANGSFRGYEISTYVEAGLAALQWQETQIQPMTSLLYTHLDQDEFTESTAPSVKLNIDSSNVDSYVGSLGTRVYRSFTMAEDAEIVPELRVRWAHEFGDTDRDVAASFVNTVTAPSGFTVKGAETGRDVAVIGLGWTVIGEGGTTLSLNYDATVNEDIAAHALTVGLLIHY